jgi:hypothetical protein
MKRTIAALAIAGLIGAPLFGAEEDKTAISADHITLFHGPFAV